MMNSSGLWFTPNNDPRLMRTRLKFRLIFALSLLISIALSHLESAPSSSHLLEVKSASAQSNACPVEQQAPSPTPGTTRFQLELDYWVQRWDGQFSLDDPLMTELEIEAHNATLLDEGEGRRGTISLGQPIHAAVLSEQVKGRLEYLSSQFDSGLYVNREREALSDEERDRFKPRLIDGSSASFHVALEELQILCGPYPGELEKTKGDAYIDRNSCTRIRPQALVQVLQTWEGGLKLVRTRLALGWIKDDARLSPPLNEEHIQAYLSGPFGYTQEALSIDETLLPSRTRVPLSISAEDRETYRRSPDQSALRRKKLKARAILYTKSPVLIATAKGVQEIQRPTSIMSAPKMLTRRHFLKTLFSYVDHPYGLGGMKGGIDCSRLIIDVLEPYGLKVPRYSGHQAKMGTFTIDLTEIKSLKRRTALLDESLKRGITLMYLPGHITTYLGRNHDGVPMLFHGLADYQQTCEGDEGETTMRVNHVTVTDVYRGEGSSKGSYLERATQLIVIGEGPGPALAGVATARVPAPLNIPTRRACRKTKNRARIFTSPHRPNAKQSLKVMITRPSSDRPAALTLVHEDGTEITPELKRLGGPPYVYYTELPEPIKGRWRAVFGESSDWRACTHFKVTSRPKPIKDDPNIWSPREEWSGHTEALFAGWVERLFQYPIEEDRSWTNLQGLILETDQNLLYGHLSASEDSALKLQPDCADLPYTLRGYFAWKMGLPFSYMTCSRGSKKRAPRCSQREDSRQPREGRSIGKAFQWFARKGIAGHVHSASARTLPDDNETDLYPISLTRESLRPGVVFADPYGHLLLIASWVPQPLGGYGILIGADGQPDGTIGRRRFWEGSFLFDPDRTLVGAGFKAFRPLTQTPFGQKPKKKKKKKRSKDLERGGADPDPEDDPEEDLPWRALRNEELTSKRVGALAFSLEQYEGSTLDFYDKMGGLSSPRPIDINAHMSALSDALFESARRRVLSVQNGEDYVLSHRRRPMKMPSGYSIFETAGPWEDFATPSRDMRLLIAIDTVLDLPQAIERTPRRFGLSPDEISNTKQALQSALQSALKSRTFQYVKSDGTPHTLSLFDLTQRQAELEMAYNPNDCIELRWGAPAGTEEYATCQRFARKRQRKKMTRYRSWFHTRKRPPRGTRR
jgi:hypothetical protein